MKTIKLQIPMDEAVRNSLEAKARSLGFDSAQAYIRVWAKAEVDGRKVDLNVDDWGEPSPEALARYEKQLKQYERDKKAGLVKSFGNVDDLLADLNK